MFFVKLGDIEVTGRGNQSLDMDDEIPVHYSVSFYEIPNDIHQTLHVNDEMSMMRLLIEWLQCDSVDEYHENMVKIGLKQPFLP